MTIGEYKAHRERLTEHIAATLKGFSIATGLGVDSIRIDRLPVHGDAPCYLVDVEVRL